MYRFMEIAIVFFVLCGSAVHASKDLGDCQISDGPRLSEGQDFSAQTQAAMNPENSAGASGNVSGDPDLPTVLDMNSIARADWSEPDEAIISSAVTQAVITFSKPMAESGAGSVRAPQNWLVVSSGENALIETEGCGSIIGDDIALTINTINYNYVSGKAVLLLDNAAGLQAGAYRLLACSSLTDIAGLGLDGAADGGGAEDYRRDFRVTVNPRAHNPNFDQGLLGWTPFSSAGQNWIQILEDGEGQPYSGAARLHSSSIAGVPWIEQCTPAPDAGSFGFSALARIQSGAAGLRSIQASIEWFDGTGCIGRLLATQHSNTLFQSTPDFGELFIAPAVPPAIALSARLRFSIQTSGVTSVNFDLDRVHFPDMDLLFRSDFDSTTL